MKYVALAVLILALIAVGPLATIWAWNTLFGSVHMIAYTIETWAAVIIIGGLFRANIKSSS
jgi:hypothetical protein